MICVNEKNGLSSHSYIKILLSQTLVKSSQKNTVGQQFIAMQNGEFLSRIWKHECLHGCEGGGVVTAQNLVQDESVGQ